MLEAIMIFGMICGLGCFPTQIYRIYKLKSATEFAWMYLIMSIFSVACVAYYTLIKVNDTLLVTYYSLMILCLCFIVGQKIYYGVINAKEKRIQN